MTEQEPTSVIEETILGVERGTPWPDEGSVTFQSAIDRQHKGIRFGLEVLPAELVPGWIMITNLETGEVSFRPPHDEKMDSSDVNGPCLKPGQEAGLTLD